MKRQILTPRFCVILIISFGLFINLSYSQSLGLNYYTTGTGQNLTANYSFHIKKSEFGFGLGYNINRVAHPDDQNNVYYKRLYATEPLHHLNLNLFYHRSIFPNLEPLNTFVFYDFQVKHSPAMNRLEPSSDNLKRYHGPYYWLDKTVGLGFNVNIFGNLYLQQKAGIGAHFILKSNQEAARVNSNPSYFRPVWELIGLLNAGIVYKFK